MGKQASVFVCITCAACLIGLSAQTVSQLGSVEGIVTDADSHSPIAGLRVVLTPTPQDGGRGGSSRQLIGVSDRVGRFSIVDVPEGLYSAAAAGDGVASLAHRILIVDRGQNVTGIDLHARIYGTISGRVLKRNKEPAGRVLVSLLYGQYRAGAISYRVEKSAAVGPGGEYVLRRVEPGRPWIIVARPRGERVQARSNAPQDQALRKPALIPAYYPGVDDPSGSAALTLRSGEQREHVDIEISTAASHCIEAVLEAGGAPAGLDFTVRRLLHSRVREEGAATARGTAAADGKIRVCDLPAGEYEVSAFAQYAGLVEPGGTPAANKLSQFGSTLVTIRDEDVRDVKVAATEGEPFTLSAVWDGDPPDKASAVGGLVNFESIDGANLLQAKIRGVPGEFTFRSMPADDYAIRDGFSASGVYLKDLIYAGSSILGLPLPLRPGASRAGLRLVLRHDGGAIRCSVTGKDGKPASEINVAVIPADTPTIPMLAESLQAGMTDWTGEFIFRTIAPGKYYVLATAARIDRAPETAALLWAARSQANDLEVGPNGTLFVALSPIDLK